MSYIDQGTLSQPAMDDIDHANQLSNHEMNGGAHHETVPYLASMEVVEHVLPSDDPVFPLNSQDVCAFIINKMIGTGIFSAPPTVLLLTRSKGEALGLWVLGFVYTLISMVIYLEYARRLPHTGAELIYIDETLPTPMLLTYTIYAFCFVFIYNTSTGAMQFANQVLITAAGPNPQYVPDQRTLRYIAISILTVICLLHYFSARAGRALNRVFAVLKIIMLSVMTIAGFVYLSGHPTSEWSLNPSTTPSSSATAFLQVLFTFSGWENATLVSGEIKNHQILKRGFVSAVWIVGILYILVNLVFLLAVSYDDLIGPNPITSYPTLLFGGSYTAKFTWAIIIAISAVANLVAVVYTFARVKQVIGMSNVLPWSKTWKASSAIRPAQEGRPLARTKVSTPQGGLILHWTFSVILIIGTAGFRTLNEAISFPSNLRTYTFSFIGLFVSAGFPFLFLDKQVWLFTPRSIPISTQRRWNETNNGGVIKKPRLLRSKFGIYFFTLAYLAFNLYITIFSILPPYQNANGQPLEIQGWYYITIIGSVIVMAIVYYFATIGLVDRNHPDRSILRLADVRPEIHQESKHHPRYGFRKTVQVIIRPGSQNPSYLYWFFGGSDETHWPPSHQASNFWNRLLGR